MALFKCKMCGGSLEVSGNESVVTCEYCGTTQTLPKIDSEKRANLYDRANHFRRNNEYDKAMGIYELILSEDRTDAEAYWSLVLCRYGIEYVEDPTSHKTVPTINRAQYTSVFDDDNYRSALLYADSRQRAIYEKEATLINELQKEILAISQWEEPFDVFICYKESDSYGRRTQDSVLAQEIYYGLKDKGFKVFFSRITLEDKLGSEYEPHTFAALHSAKVMVVLGTKRENFESVWVKNEWSRFLALIKNGERKTLIPAYRDMDPYDLPEEFSHLQAQDMAKLGFLQDLVRGIQKIIGVEKSESVSRDNGTTSAIFPASDSESPLLERAFLFLEDGNWQEADAYCEKVLDHDPQNGLAYLGKLMAELHVRRKEELKNCKDSFEANSHYQRIIRFADRQLAKEVAGYLLCIKERQETDRHLAIYNRACGQMQNAVTEQDHRRAAETFKSIRGFRDAEALMDECLKRADGFRKDAEYMAAQSLMKADNYRNYQKALTMLQKIADWEDAEKLIAVCEQRIKQIEAGREPERKDAIYMSAKASMCGKKVEKYQAALEKLYTISDWRDANKLIAICETKIQELEATAEERRLASERRRKIAKRILLCAVVLALLVGAVFAGIAIYRNSVYKTAIRMAKRGELVAAYQTFTDLDGYRDSEKRRALIQTTIQEDIVRLMQEDNYPEIARLYGAFEGSEDISRLVEASCYVVEEDYISAVACGLTSIVIPEGVTEIADFAFLECSELVSIELPATVTRIGASAFEGCIGLKEIRLPDSVVELGERAFSNCESLISVVLSENLTEISAFAFRGCESLESIVVPEKVETIGECAFDGCVNLANVTLSNGIETIGAGAFWSCVSLESISLPNSLVNIGDHAFAECEHLKTVVIPFGTRSIGNSAFFACVRLVSVTLPSGLTDIGESAFASCKRLAQITVPKDVSDIKRATFLNCDALDNVTFLSDKTSVSEDATTIPQSTKIYAPADSLAQTYATKNGRTFYEIVDGTCGKDLFWVFNFGTGTLSINGTGAMTNWNSATDVAWSQYRSFIKAVAILDGVTTIGNYAFDECTELTKVSIAKSVTAIGLGAFRGCSKLSRLTIPSQVTSIGGQAFANCRVLSYVYFAVQKGWYLAPSYNAMSGTSVSVTNGYLNATNLSTTYNTYYWKLG